MVEAAIVVDGLCKSYKRYASPLHRLGDILRPRSGETDIFHALKQISFAIKPGETWGVMGKNGSGKSTLLQIMAGTLQATSGRVQTAGRVAALLELGSGFNPEFTGRQNVYLNAQILGLSRRETDERFDAIASFADIGDFIDQPVKTYSSGMVVRLAFAVLANIEPDILLVDEALSVGDAKFQAKCMKKIRSLQKAGVTTFFVSHDMSSVKMLCDHAMLLHRGELLARGNPRDICNQYTELLSMETDEAPTSTTKTETQPVHQRGAEPSLRHGNNKVIIRHVGIFNGDGQDVQHVYTGSPFHIRIKIDAREDVQDLVVGISIRNLAGLVIYGTNTGIATHDPLGGAMAGQALEALFTIPCLLNRGIYTLSVAAHAESGVSYDWMDDILVFECVNEYLCDGIVDLRADVGIKYCEH